MAEPLHKPIDANYRPAEDLTPAEWLAQDIEYGIANAVNNAYGVPWSLLTPEERIASGFGMAGGLSMDDCMRLAAQERGKGK